MKRSGTADLPLHYGYVPQWLAERMAKLGLGITESIITDYGNQEMLRRLSDPFWFQSLGAVMGMDWHSSGITTSVMGALKKAINPLSKELGIFICGGKGKYSKQTPNELFRLANATGMNGSELIQASKLTAKVDSSAIQDGFQLYTHNFIVSNTGQWTVVQQGMNTDDKTARRYHWHSAGLDSFVDAPHTGICGKNQGEILNLVSSDAGQAREAIVQLTIEKPDLVLKEFGKLIMPNHHEVTSKDVNLKRLGAALWLAHEQQVENFESLLLLQGVGGRTLQSLALVSEVIHGTPSRFKDPARFSFAHGGKDGHPFPVPTKLYDETIQILRTGIEKSKLGFSEKTQAVKKLHEIAIKAENDFIAEEANFEKLIQKENNESWQYGGKTVFGDAKPGKQKPGNVQLRLF
jgi:hypothetical protein